MLVSSEPCTISKTQCCFLTSGSQDVWSAEGHACVKFTEARRRQFPDSGAEWMECAGAYAVFDGIDSPVTQSFGLGIFEQMSAASLDVIERFFLDRGAAVLHEVSPLAGAGALDLLCARDYRPFEISNVLYRPVEKLAAEDHAAIRVHAIGPEEAQLWTDISARGWTHEHPELMTLSSGSGRHLFSPRAEFVLPGGG